MTFSERLNGDLKSAMKSGDSARLEVLRYMLSLVQNAAKDKFAKQPGIALTDDEAIAALQREAKRRKEALELFRKGGRGDLVKKEEADLAVIYEYIPKGLSAEELDRLVDQAREGGANDFNSLMRETMKLVKGRADGKAVGEIVRRKLG